MLCYYFPICIWVSEVVLVSQKMFIVSYFTCSACLSHPKLPQVTGECIATSSHILAVRSASQGQVIGCLNWGLS
jgi:hypothetical protein